MPTCPPAILELTAHQARLLQLAAQGLLHVPAARPTPQALERAVRQMQMLQIDTIHVVARSPYLTLFSRVGSYPEAWLDELLATGRLAECWAHEACFVASADYPLHESCRPLRHGHWAHKHARRMRGEQGEAMRQLLQRIRVSGPARASDFERSGPPSGGWWQWKPEKRWLEAWFALGELMVARRDRFQRVYDLSERVRARHPPASVEPVDAAAARRLAIARSVRALGVAQACWIGDYFRLGKVGEAELRPLLDAGELARVEVRGWDGPGYVHRDQAELARRAAAGRLRATHSTLLSPFDPLVWDRARVEAMFGFSYTLECYVPAPRRRYGYFVLPILHRGRLVGRLDAKAHRTRGVFEVKTLHMEPSVALSDAVAAGVARAIVDCARWHATAEVRIGQVRPRTWAPRIRGALRKA